MRGEAAESRVGGGPESLSHLLPLRYTPGRRRSIGSAQGRQDLRDPSDHIGGTHNTGPSIVWRGKGSGSLVTCEALAPALLPGCT